MQSMRHLNNAEKRQIIRSAKFLLDNQQFNLLYTLAVSEKTQQLTQGPIDGASSNLRNLRALEEFEQFIQNWATQDEPEN